MKCERRDLGIAKLAGGDLAGWRAARLQRHLDVCPRCASLFAELETQCKYVRDSDSETDSTISIANAVLVHVDQRGHRFGLRGGIAVSVVCATMLIGTAVWQLSSIDPPSPPQTAVALTPLYEPPAAPEPNGLAATEHSNVVIQMVTNNPDVVIYWLGDSAGEL